MNVYSVLVTVLDIGNRAPNKVCNPILPYRAYILPEESRQ